MKIFDQIYKIAHYSEKFGDYIRFTERNEQVPIKIKYFHVNFSK